VENADSLMKRRKYWQDERPSLYIFQYSSADLCKGASCRTPVLLASRDTPSTARIKRPNAYCPLMCLESKVRAECDLRRVHCQGLP
jgi:hypothetical protein